MGSMGSRGSPVLFSRFGRRGLTTAALLWAVACAPKAPPQASATAPASPPAPAPAPATPVAAAANELPDGPGKRILTNACVACHALTEVTKFRGFYGRPQWRDIVQTMVDYGAPVGEKDAEILTDYLTENLGKK